MIKYSKKDSKEINSLIRQELLKLKEEAYKDFSSKLIPGMNNILGVRIPKLRDMAKKIAKGDYKEYLENPLDEYFEEVMLQGLTIGYLKEDIDYILKEVEKFIPKINNWSICDSFCIGLKIVKKNKYKVLEFLRRYLDSDKEYYIRFSVVILLDFYVEEEYIDRVLKELDRIRHDGYYVKMAVAWAISTCYIKFPERTMKYLKEKNTLDNYTYNKSLQKICESLKIDKETKEAIKSMKRKI